MKTKHITNPLIGLFALAQIGCSASRGGRLCISTAEAVDINGKEMCIETYTDATGNRYREYRQQNFHEGWVSNSVDKITFQPRFRIETENYIFDVPLSPELRMIGPLHNLAAGMIARAE